MKTLSEVIEMMGMAPTEEANVVTGVDENGLPISVTIPASNPSEGVNFYGVSLSKVTGNPAEFAAEKCDSDCWATTDEDTLYVATKGSCSVGTQITE